MPKDADATDEDGWLLCDAEGCAVMPPCTPSACIKPSYVKASCDAKGRAAMPPCMPSACSKPSYVKASVYDVDLSSD